ncbi:MAG TPA: hypothetical protein VGM23_08150 [Armatimonadota bacterium]
MDLSTQPAAPSNPELLAGEAARLLNADLAAFPGRTAIEEAIRRAHQMVAADLAIFDQRRQANQEIDCRGQFGAQLHDKVAALTFITRHKLIDIALAPPSLEITQARRDLTGSVDILFRAGAAEALGVLIDFAGAQPDDPETHFWSKVRQHCLLLMAQIPEARPAVFAFLSERAEMRRLIEQMMAADRPAVAAAARALGEEYVQARRAGAIAAPPPSPAMLRYAQYEQVAPGQQAVGLASLLAAMDRVRQALDTNDYETLVTWATQGSPAVCASVLRAARDGWPAGGYLELLQKVLAVEEVEPPRLAAAVLELGKINGTAQGGIPDIIRIFVEVAQTDDSMRRTGVAKLAVRELGRVDAFNEVLTVMETAPIVEVAEEAILAMRDLRRLNMAESVVRSRASLLEAYDSAREYIYEVSNLMEAAFSAPSELAAQTYFNKMKERKAYAELEKLLKRKDFVGKMAQQTLTEMRLGEKK